MEAPKIFLITFYAVMFLLLNKLTRNISNKHKWEGLTRGFIL